MVKINVFNEYITETIKKSIKKEDKVTYNFIKDKLDSLFKYYYWSKTECEFMVNGIFSDEENAIKASVYDQLEPNLDRICEYVIRELNIEL